MSCTKEFEHLRIQLGDIKLATNDFADNHCIGRGGFGKVYRGELLLSEKLTMVAVKRLNSTLGQGLSEFWKEIMTLSLYKHENLVSLLGFCDESGENIIVYEYLSNRSLDLNLSNTNLTWNQRLHICIGAARGIQYLHDPIENQHRVLHHRVLHRDIKSANILLDHNWNAKISDFGLSKFGPANQQFTFLFSNAVGTFGYCDPLYLQCGYLTKESDVYSFGVVLFEVLCGRSCVETFNDGHQVLAILAQKRYEEGAISTIINDSVKEQISPKCLEKFSNIAYKCLKQNRTERPSMDKIVKELEIALQYQVEYESKKENGLEGHTGMVLESDSDKYWETKLPHDWEAIIKMFNIPFANNTTKIEVFSVLHKGILFDEGNKFFWINIDGKKCVLISAKRFLDLSQSITISPTWEFQPDLRFPIVATYSNEEIHDINCQIKTSMLSFGTLYAANLVFKYQNQSNEHLDSLKLTTIKWKMEELNVHSTHTAELTLDNWYKIRMWHFVNHGTDADFDFVLEKLSYVEDPVDSNLLIQGIEFQPVEMYQEIDGSKSISTSNEEDVDEDVYWEKKLPNDYQDYIQISDKGLYYNSKKELYELFCAGFLCYNGGLWFSLCKSTGGICSMLPAKDVLHYDACYELLNTLALSESRFSNVKKVRSTSGCRLTCRLQSSMFSPKNIYACYLVFKFSDNYIQPDDTHLLKAYCSLDGQFVSTTFIHLNFTPLMNIPTIKSKNDYESHDMSSIPKIEALRMPKGWKEHGVHTWMEQRNDGWLEVVLCKSLDNLEARNSLNVLLDYNEKAFNEIIVEGVEFRPMQGKFKDVSDVCKKNLQPLQAKTNWNLGRCKLNT